MCFKPKTPKLDDPTPPPEETADPTKIGDKRQAEDKTLFGGVPNLRVDRSATAGGVGSTGTGLNVLGQLPTGNK